MFWLGFRKGIHYQAKACACANAKHYTDEQHLRKIPSHFILYYKNSTKRCKEQHCYSKQ